MIIISKFRESYDREGVLGPIKSIFRILFYFVGLGIALVVFLLFIGVIFFVIQGTANAQETGLLQVAYTKTDVALNNIPLVNNVYASAKNLVKVQQDPSLLIRDYGWRTDIEKNQDNQELGLVFIRKFSPLKETYLKNEEIVLTTSAEIKSLKKDSSIRFYCESKELEQGVITVNPNEPIPIRKDERIRIPVTCRIPGGSFGELSNDLQVSAKKIKLNAVYDFKTDSYLDVYTMQKSYLDDFINKGIDPFENEINPRLNKATGEVTPTTTYGPMKLILRLDYTQPLNEQGPFSNENTYLLGLKLEKTNSLWFGKINKINNIFINLPSNFELVDDNFESFFDFSETSSQDSGTFNRYKAKQEKINELNNQCDNYGGKDTIECADLFERGFILALTSFRINNIESPTLTKDYIGAEIDYDFQAETQTSVTLIKAIA